MEVDFLPYLPDKYINIKSEALVRNSKKIM